jgi:hypothetical protein
MIDSGKHVDDHLTWLHLLRNQVPFGREPRGEENLGYVHLESQPVFLVNGLRGALASNHLKGPRPEFLLDPGIDTDSADGLLGRDDRLTNLLRIGQHVGRHLHNRD